MKAVLSEATATAAVPAGQPEPLTATTSITTLPGGAPPSAAADGENEAATSTTAALLTITGLSMEILPLLCGRTPRATCHHRIRDMYRSG
ncbi:hypothetical protein GCM10010507_62190 [Streptomyces cinnamoneus]|uniref:Uncharacterized protein n=1 Tax=Streptomyces cinnamoneus TaxID=53446 RepID=A0A918WRP4_STRCJ|nr:hypothetical protein GCM10010507_62190 [Streptomyces cinnamoneus]